LRADEQAAHRVVADGRDDCRPQSKPLPADSDIRQRICQPAFPVRELKGLVFTYMGLQWFFELHNSFASIEDLDKTLVMPRSGIPYSDEVLPASQTLLGLYRPHLSHRWDEAEKSLPKARYFLVTVYRVRSGGQTGFADLTRIRRSRFESMNFDQPEIAYQIMSGAPSGTFLFITPLVSMKTFDDGLAKTPDGPRESSAEQKLAAEVEIGHESFLFRIDPRASYVSEDFAAGDPEFWARPKNQ